MRQFPDILIFSDLDGTLLDHRDYSWQPARAALERLRDTGAGLILASSKTAAEMERVRSAIGFADWPAIVENGGGLLEPGQDREAGNTAYEAIRALLRDLPEGFRGFGDMSAREVAELTGLGLTAAEMAKARQFTEPGIWTGDESELSAFEEAAKRVGLTARHGGRFLTLSFDMTKADQMEALIRRFRPRVTLALGDAPNDIEMLERADFGVIVANHSGPAVPVLPGERTGRIRRTRAEGPEGWAEAVMAFLNEQLPLKGERAHG